MNQNIISIVIKFYFLHLSLVIYKQLLDEVFVIFRIIKFEVGVRLIITRTESNNCFSYTLNEFFLSRFDMKCFHRLCQLFLFLRFSQFFLLRVISKQLLRRPVCVCESFSSTIFLARSTKQTWKSSFCFFTDDKQHKARELEMITLRNHATRSYMTWLPLTLNVFDMIIV